MYFNEFDPSDPFNGKIEESEMLKKIIELAGREAIASCDMPSSIILQEVIKQLMRGKSHEVIAATIKTLWATLQARLELENAPKSH